MNNLDAADLAIRIRQNPFNHAAREDDDIVRLSGLAQAINQFLASPARQAVHAQGRVAGIIEVVDHVEGEPVSFGQPLNQRPCALCDGFNHGGLGFALGFALNVGGKQSRDYRRCLWRAGTACPPPE